MVGFGSWFDDLKSHVMNLVYSFHHQEKWPSLSPFTGCCLILNVVKICFVSYPIPYPLSGRQKRLTEMKKYTSLLVHSFRIRMTMHWWLSFNKGLYRELQTTLSYLTYVFCFCGHALLFTFQTYEYFLKDRERIGLLALKVEILKSSWLQHTMFSGSKIYASIRIRS